MEESDEQLVGACRRGDNAAWERLINRYQRLVYAIPLRAGLGPDLAAEVFQRTFTRLFEHLERLEQPERLAAWLATTARRESWRISQTERRSDSLEATLSAEPSSLDWADEALLPVEQLEQLEEQQQIRVAVSQLEPRCQNLIRLLFFHPEPPAYSDVAAQLGVSVGSIGPTRARCFEKLRRLLTTLR